MSEAWTCETRFDSDALWAEVLAERAKQQEKWGDQHHADGCGTHQTFRGEPFFLLRDHAQKVCDWRHGNGGHTWEMILLEEVFEALCETDAVKRRKELVQCMAVILNWEEDVHSRARLDEPLENA